MRNAEITDPVNRDIDAIHNLEWIVQSMLETLANSTAMTSGRS